MNLRTYFLVAASLSLVISLVTITYAYYLAGEIEDTRTNLELNETISRDISKISISILDPNISIEAIHVDRITGVIDRMIADATTGNDYALLRHLASAKRFTNDLKNTDIEIVKKNLLSQLRLRLLEAQTASRITVSKWNKKFINTHNQLYYSIIVISILSFFIITAIIIFIYILVVKPLDIFSSGLRTHTPGAKIKLRGSTKITQVENLYRSFAQMDGKLADTFRVLTESEKNLQLALADAEKANKEKKETENSLRRAQRMEAVGQLTGGIAHDFNNLLNVMIGNAEILEDIVKENEEARHNIQAIIRAVDRGASLTQRLLAFSRQQSLAAQPTAIIDLVRSLEDMFQRTLGETIELRTHLGSGSHVSLIDPHQLENALINLAINARDAMPNGGALTIEIANVTLDAVYARSHEEVTPGNYVKVGVSDTGTGIAPDVLEKVFEPFFTTKDVGKGSGLGLSMVYGFVKQSNGHVTINSEIGRGTTVELYMPRTQDVAIHGDDPNEPFKPERGFERILVVEDNPGVREVSINTLRSQGYEVVEASNGEEAIKHMKDGEPFALLFTDIILPGGMNGVEIAKEAKLIQPNLKVLYASGYADSSILRSDNSDHEPILLNKPYRRLDLLEKIKNILNSSPYDNA